MAVHRFSRLCVIALCCLSFTATVSAGATLYVSLQDRYLNDRIEQLRVATQMPTMHKPFAVSEVRHYLNRIRKQMPGLYSEIDRSLQRYEQSVAITSAELSAATARETEHPLIMANARGEQASSHYRAGFSAAFKPFEYLALSLGASAHQQPNETIPLDSYLVLGSGAFQIDFGYREHWLSPFDNGAMLFSSNAKPPLSFGLSNPIPYSDWWHLQYDIFVARLDRVPVYFGPEWEMGYPVVLGNQLSFSPLDGWTIALTRTMQFGGGAREVSASSIWQAFIDPQTDHGAPSGEQCAAGRQLCEFGNQQAAISNRIDFGGRTPFSIYFEFAGEDSEQINNYYLGNLSVAIGLYLPFMPEVLFGPDWSLRYEYQQWQDAWYTHSIYPQGYSNGGVVLGHWGGSQRAFGDAVGATMQSLVLGRQLGPHNRYEWRFKQLQNENYGQNHYATYHDLELRYFDRIWQQDLMLSLTNGKDVFGDHFWRIETQWSW